jgi:hypothetical protein
MNDQINPGQIVLTGSTDVGRASSTNQWASQFYGLIIEPRLDAASATAWYMAADRNITEVLEHAYLSGGDAPTVATREGWQTDGLEFKIRHDFAIAPVDHRGLYKSPGA